jgi:hypothetical protein
VISTETAGSEGRSGRSGAHPARSGVDDGKAGPYKAANWRRAEILPPMFFQEQFANIS